MTFLAYIDGRLLKDMVLSGAALLEKNKQSIDALNVFPVPDGDTGTNMSLTMVSAVKELMGVDSASASVVAQAVARGALKGARGNSGVILSQLFRGFSKALAGVEHIDSAAMAAALQGSVEAAYKAVMKPKEGTMLTVAKALADSAQQDAQEGKDLYTLMENLLTRGNEMLKRTPDMLPVLKQAGVVDAGGAGLLAIYLGFKMAIDGEENIEGAQLMSRITALQDQNAQQNLQGQAEEESIEFGYCTETFIKQIKQGVTQENIDKLREKLSKIGDCVLVVGDLEMIKVHCHSNNPGKVLQYCLQLGELSSIKVDNMREQHRTLIQEADTLQKEVPVFEKEVGFVAVAAGDGLAALFKDLAVDEVVVGGQTMNPSAEDIASAVCRTKAKTVYVLPNNKNIIMAAQQAKELLEEYQVLVIPTKSIPQGVSAMIAYVPDVSLEENERRMTEAAQNVKTASVTYAVRDSSFDGQEIHQNDILGLQESRVEVVGQDVETVALELLQKTVNDGSEVITIFYGQDVSQEQAQALHDKVMDAYPSCDVDMLPGGQPLYYYLFSVE